MPQPSISTIIPAHNRPHYLREAIRSIVGQSFGDWEIIIVDDGSVEGTFDVLKEETKDLPVVWHRQSPAGPGVARQTGLALSSGDYVTFLDDDDYYLPGHFQQLIDATAVTDRQIIRSGLIGKNRDGTLVQYPGYRNDKPSLEQYWKTPSNLTALMFTHEAANKVPIDTIRTTIEDFTWLTRVFSHYDFYQTDGYTAVYVLHDTNRNNNSAGKLYLEDRLKAMEIAFSYGKVSDRVGKQTKNIWVTHQYLHFARNSIREGRWGQAITGLKGGLRHASLGNAKELAYTSYFVAKSALRQLVGKT